MRWRSQRGMTLIELLVSMSVTSILLLGLGSVFFTVSGRYQNWAHRLQTASVGAGLAASLQADSHRYVRCDSTRLETRPLSEISLCAPDDRRTAVVTYSVDGPAGGPWVITRQQGSQAAFMLRSDTQPYFWLDCWDNNNTSATVSGHIHVYDLRSPDDSPSLDPNSRPETFSVYYVAPGGALGCNR
jgi:prepilin-type N-terminal cleavage/methylation domain-containing protein